MVIAFGHPLYFFAWPILALLAVYLAYRRPSRSRLAILIRWLLLALLVTAASEPVLGANAARQTLVVLADQSESLGETGQAHVREMAASLLAQQPDATLLAFGGTPWPVVDPTRWISSEAFDRRATDIESALNLAAHVIGSGGGRIILLSDGQETLGNAEAAAQRLASAGIPVDVWPIAPPTADTDVRVNALTMPSVLYLSQIFDAEAEIMTSHEISVALHLSQGGEMITERKVTLTKGANTFRLEQTAEVEGFVGLTLEVIATDDVLPQNNRASAVAQVYPSPRILIVSNQLESLNGFRRALRAAGITSDVVSAADLPTKMSGVTEYQALFLADVGAEHFSLEQMALIESFVRDEGRGLVTTGGPHSYILSGDKDTPLEAVRPVEMQPPSKPEEPQVTLLLIMDNSRSMRSVGAGSLMQGTRKIVLAQQAAVLATQTLKPADQVGVLVFNDAPSWAVEIRPVGAGADLAEVQAQILSIETTGGTNIIKALTEGLQALAAAPPGSRHAILLSDGRPAAFTFPDYEGTILEARRQNITLSTIALGEDADTELLRQLAEWGQGRFYYAEVAETLPVLVAEEAARMSEAPLSEGLFQPELGVPHPVLAGLSPGAMPELTGYHALIPKPTAEVVLRTAQGDPLLAIWQYGLGRSVAWTSDLGEAWASEWPAWEDFGRMWAQIIAYTLPDPTLAQLSISAAVDGRTATITAEALDAAGRPITLAPTTVMVTAPDGSAWKVPLVEVLPGRYQQSVAASTEGPYHVVVEQEVGREVREAETGFAIGYSLEYAPDGSGDALLAYLAALTGGQVLTEEALIVGSDDAETGPSVLPLWQYLLAATAILWPLDITIRRWRMPWQH